MASFWGLIVALLALNAGFSVAQNATANNTVIAATPTTPLAVVTSTIGGAGGGGGGGGGSSQIVPTPTASVAPTSTSASTPSRNDTYLKVNFTASTCPSANDTSLTSLFRDIYGDEKFHLKRIDYSVTRDICHFNFILTFGPGLKENNITEVLEAKLTRMKNIVDGMTLSNITTEVHVDGVSLGEFKATDDECKKICCEGTGGPITVKRICKPLERCRNYKLEKKVSDCMNVCSDKCPGVTMYKTSLLILLFGVFMNWFLK